MKNKITERKCKDCDTVRIENVRIVMGYIIDYIPRKVRCLDCHQKYIDNAMISTKKKDD